MLQHFKTIFSKIKSLHIVVVGRRPDDGAHGLNVWACEKWEHLRWLKWKIDRKGYCFSLVHTSPRVVGDCLAAKPSARTPDNGGVWLYARGFF